MKGPGFSCKWSPGPAPKPAPGPSPLPPKKYKAIRGSIANIPGLTKTEPHSGVIWYPESSSDSDKFPVVVFGHGMGGGYAMPESYAADMSAVAEYGFIVVGPQSCPTMDCGARFADDLLATLDAAKAHGTALHEGFARADFSRTAVYGHSMGAMATVRAAAANPSYNLKAAVAQHACIDPTAGQPESAIEIHIPMLYTTGLLDTICPLPYTTSMYEVTPTNPRVAISWNTATHMDPVNGFPLRELDPTARFLACHVRGEHCDTAGEDFCAHSGADVCVYNSVFDAAASTTAAAGSVPPIAPYSDYYEDPGKDGSCHAGEVVLNATTVKMAKGLSFQGNICAPSPCSRYPNKTLPCPLDGHAGYVECGTFELMSGQPVCSILCLAGGITAGNTTSPLIMCPKGARCVAKKPNPNPNPVSGYCTFL